MNKTTYQSLGPILGWFLQIKLHESPQRCEICENFLLQNKPQNISSSMQPELTYLNWFTICAGNCGVPVLPSNGTIVNSTGTLEGSVIYYQCNPGFVPVDVMSAICTAAGSWSPDPANATCRELGMMELIGVVLEQGIYSTAKCTCDWDTESEYFAMKTGNICVSTSVVILSGRSRGVPCMGSMEPPFHKKALLIM